MSCTDTHKEPNKIVVTFRAICNGNCYRSNCFQLPNDSDKQRQMRLYIDTTICEPRKIKFAIVYCLPQGKDLPDDFDYKLEIIKLGQPVYEVPMYKFIEHYCYKYGLYYKQGDKETKDESFLDLMTDENGLYLTLRFTAERKANSLAPTPNVDIPMDISARRRDSSHSSSCDAEKWKCVALEYEDLVRGSIYSDSIEHLRIMVDGRPLSLIKNLIREEYRYVYDIIRGDTNDFNMAIDFDAITFDEMPATSTNMSNTVVLNDDVSYEVMASFLEYLCTRKIKINKLDFAIKLYELSFKYSIRSLWTDTESYIADTVDADNVLEVLNFGVQNSSQVIEEAALKYVVENKSELANLKGYDSLDSRLLRKIVQQITR